MRGARAAVRVAVVALAFGGCAPAWWPFPNRATSLLDAGDRLVERGEYERALASYDELLRSYPDSGAARLARPSRDAVQSVVAARAEMARLRAEIAAQEAELQRLKQGLALRESEMARMRQELGARQAEAERLRADLERLKQIDMRLERRRP